MNFLFVDADFCEKRGGPTLGISGSGGSGARNLESKFLSGQLAESRQRRSRCPLHAVVGRHRLYTKLKIKIERLLAKFYISACRILALSKPIYPNA